MRPSTLKRGDIVVFDGCLTTRKMRFIKRILGNGLTKTESWFESKELGMTTLTDYEISRRVKRIDHETY